MYISLDMETPFFRNAGESIRQPTEISHQRSSPAGRPELARRNPYTPAVFRLAPEFVQDALPAAVSTGLHRLAIRGPNRPANRS